MLLYERKENMEEMMKVFQGKKLLVLGGMELLREAIEKAKCLGATVYVTDNIENSPAKKYADKSFMVSATDVESLKTLCQEEGIDGIFTAYADVLLPYYSKLCSEVGLPCYGTYETFCTMIDKEAFKRTCERYDVSVPQEYADTGAIEYPVIVKPVDSSGSRGITVCNNEAGLNDAIEHALSFSNSKKIIIEKYMQGDEVVCYYYMQDGVPTFVGMCDRYVTNSSNGIGQLPVAYIYPSKHTAVYIQETDTRVKNMLKGIGMENGPIFLQGFFDGKETILYEPGYRLCGAREHCIIGPLTGINSEDMLINFALTGKMSDESLAERLDPFLGGRYGCKLSPVLRQGVVDRIEGIEEASEKTYVKYLYLNRKEGDVVTDKETGTLATLAYRAYIVADSIEELSQYVSEVQNLISYYDDNGNPMISSTFDISILSV